MEIPVLVLSLKSSILSSTSFHMGKTFWGVMSAAVEQSRRKANMVAQGDGKFGPKGWPQNSSKPKKTTHLVNNSTSNKLIDQLFTRLPSLTYPKTCDFWPKEIISYTSIRFRFDFFLTLYASSDVKAQNLIECEVNVRVWFFYIIYLVREVKDPPLYGF